MSVWQRASAEPPKEDRRSRALFETDDAGRQSIRTDKVDATATNFDEGVLNVLAEGKVDVASVALFAHATTAVINALTERKSL